MDKPLSCVKRQLPSLISKEDLFVSSMSLNRLLFLYKGVVVIYERFMNNMNLCHKVYYTLFVKLR